MDRAPVEKIEGLAPAIAINQKSASRNPRSTVATVTEIQDYLRLLWARIGEPHCWQCGRAIEGFNPSAGARRLQQEEGRGWLCARLDGSKDGAVRRKELLKEGFVRLHTGDAEVLLEDAGSEALLKEGCLLVIDRIKPAGTERARLAEALQTAYGYGGGKAWYLRRGGEPLLLTEQPTCVEHGPVLPAELTPRHFSFNSWVGGCPTCDGLGRITSIDPALLIPKPHLKLWDSLDPRVASVLKRSAKQKARIQGVLKHLGLKLGDRVETYTEDHGDGPPTLLLHGFTGDTTTMRSLADALDGTGKRILLDLVGHGRSAAPRIPRYGMDLAIGQIREVVAGLEQPPVLILSLIHI